MRAPRYSPGWLRRTFFVIIRCGSPKEEEGNSLSILLYLHAFAAVIVPFGKRIVCRLRRYLTRHNHNLRDEVYSTSATVNTFQLPHSRSHTLLECYTITLLQPHTRAETLPFLPLVCGTLPPPYSRTTVLPLLTGMGSCPRPTHVQKRACCSFFARAMAVRV